MLQTDVEPVLTDHTRITLRQAERLVTFDLIKADTTRLEVTQDVTIPKGSTMHKLVRVRAFAEKATIFLFLSALDACPRVTT